MKKFIYLALSSLLFSTGALGEVDCEKTMEQIDKVNASQIDFKVGELSFGELMSKNALLLRAGGKMNRFRALAKAGTAQVEQGFLKALPPGKISEVMQDYFPGSCGDTEIESPEDVTGDCRGALSEALSLEHEEFKAKYGDAFGRKYQAINTNLGIAKKDPRMVQMSLVKKKLAQDYVRSCPIQDAETDLIEKLSVICDRKTDDSQKAVLSLTTDTMNVIGFLGVELNKVSDADFQKACGELSEQGIEIDGCEISHSPQEGNVPVVVDVNPETPSDLQNPDAEVGHKREPVVIAGTPGQAPLSLVSQQPEANFNGLTPNLSSTNGSGSRPENSDTPKPPKEINPCGEGRAKYDGRCMDATMAENLKKQDRRRRWNKIGKIAGYTALAGGAIAGTAWAINKLAGKHKANSTDDSSSSSSSSGTLLPTSYRSSYFYPNYMGYGNMNYSHYYMYPNSYSDRSWIGYQDFNNSSPYSIESYNPAGTNYTNGSGTFSFDF